MRARSPSSAILSRRISDQPLVLACTALAVASGGERGPLATFVAGRGPRILELGDLSEEATAALAATRIGARPRADSRSRVVLATGGNPWLIEELIEAARAEGIPTGRRVGRALGRARAGGDLSASCSVGLDARAQAFAEGRLGARQRR